MPEDRVGRCNPRQRECSHAGEQAMHDFPTSESPTRGRNSADYWQFFGHGRNGNRTSGTENSITTDQPTPISRSLTQVTADHTGIVGNGYFRIGQVWMPNLFPFEAIEALIARRTQRINLTLDGNVPSAS